LGPAKNLLNGLWRQNGPGPHPRPYDATVLLDRVALTPEELRDATGWEVRPEGACRGTQCVPLAGLTVGPDGTLDVRAFASQMAMPVAEDRAHGLVALGPPVGGHVLEDAQLPEIVLPGFDGVPFDVGVLRGRKVLLLAWASW
jgi:hypothetical protein